MTRFDRVANAYTLREYGDLGLAVSGVQRRLHSENSSSVIVTEVFNRKYQSDTGYAYFLMSQSNVNDLTYKRQVPNWPDERFICQF